MIDPEMSIRYTKITLEVKRSDAMDVLGKYVCKCQAASAQGEVSSRDASVNVACKLKLQEKKTLMIKKTKTFLLIGCKVV